ncbi:PREDICTED: uncharacterized protein LOC109227752 [Nicotiana attenuata]|uniref:uncharacterized protein LOC109227752 n=1 Tax=Nicotiana attenuata TaxID=49451 RepID=UPI000904A5E8|nr:PREDICTED: uncharacterized protein LOC109227752 [Nicotiana attenuata]
MPALIPEVERELLLNSGTPSGIWTLFMDGASNAKGFGLGIVLKPPTGNVVRQSIRTMKLINNEAEYEAMIAGLELAEILGAEVLEAKCDCLFMVNQVNGTFDVNEEQMRRYLDKLQVTLCRFKEWTLQHVPEDQNSEADALANLGSSVNDDEFSFGTVVQLMKSVVKEGHAELEKFKLGLEK